MMGDQRLTHACGMPTGLRNFADNAYINLQAYMDSNLMHLFRTLITGGELTDLEKALGEGLGVFRRHALADITSARNRSILVLLALNEHPLHQIQVTPPTKLENTQCSRIDTQINVGFHTHHSVNHNLDLLTSGSTDQCMPRAWTIWPIFTRTLVLTDKTFFLLECGQTNHRRN